MVKRSGLEFDEALFDGESKPRRARKHKDEFPKEHAPRLGRVDNVLAVSIVLALLILVVLGITYSKENWFAVVLIGLMFLASELFALPMRPAGRLSIALLPLVM